MNVIQYLDKLIKSLTSDVEEMLKANKPSKKDVWNQTVAFLAQHGEKGYQRIHAENQARAATPEKGAAPKASTPKAEAPASVPKGPDRKGENGEVTHVKGKIGPRKVSYPIKENGKETGQKGFRVVNSQEVHHFKWQDNKWNHTHTTHTGEGLNSRG
jgi:hypothetical protein